MATGNRIKTIATFFRIGKSTLQKMIPKVCQVIYEVLQEEYLPFPDHEDDSHDIANNFYSKWDFINCIGAIDGTHIRVKAPPKSGSRYFNYKKFFSVVVMLVCDADQRIIWASVGDYGKFKCFNWVIEDNNNFNNNYFENFKMIITNI